MDYLTLETLRDKHPAWRLLRAVQAPLIASFLHRTFVVPNVREMEQPQLIEKLEDELFQLAEQNQIDAKDRQPSELLTRWTENGWLRKFYREGSDEPYFDLTPATEKAIAWLVSLTKRSFVGTESRLLTVFELLKQIVEGTETDPDVRIAELKKRRAEITAEIERLSEGHISLLGETAVKERFEQFQVIARELLSDFREVEQNFRGLDRRAREQIARWDGGRGELLEQLLGERDQIGDTDQGRSFRAFWDFLMSQSRQEELTDLLDRVLALPSVCQLRPDGRLKRVHYDWLEAGDHTQRTVAQLSQQLRRFLDDAALLENKRIMELMHSIEKRALDVRLAVPEGEFISIPLPSAEIELPMERPLYTPPIKPRIKEIAADADEANVDTASLFAQIVVDKDALRRHIRQSLQQRPQVTLSQLVAWRPLEHGLAELLSYLELASGAMFYTAIDDSVEETIPWQAANGIFRRATLPRVIFSRGQ